MIAPLLQASGLHLHHLSGDLILSNVNLTIRSGERVGLVGPNGAGKSTLLLSLSGVLRPKQGEVRLKGQRLEPGRFNPEIGLVLQQAEDQLFSPTVAEDVAFGARNLGLSGKALEQATARVLDRTGISALANRPVHNLSGGEKRLACLAGVLVMEPQILLMDEPTAALDLRNRRRLIEFLQWMKQAMFIASHDLEFLLEVCPRVILIDDGRIIADGPASTILGDFALMAAHGQEVPYSLIRHELRGRSVAAHDTLITDHMMRCNEDAAEEQDAAYQYYN